MANSLSVIAVTDTSKRYIVYERKKKKKYKTTRKAE